MFSIIQKYITLGLLIGLLGSAAYASYLKLSLDKQRASTTFLKSQVENAVEINKSLTTVIELQKQDSLKAIELITKTKSERNELQREYEKTIEQLRKVDEDACWNRAVLVPCAVTVELFPQSSGLGCRL